MRHKRKHKYHISVTIPIDMLVSYEQLIDTYLDSKHWAMKQKLLCFIVSLYDDHIPESCIRSIVISAISGYLSWVIQHQATPIYQPIGELYE